MLATIIISILTCLMLVCSILFFPKIRIKTVEINTYWIVCAIGALFILIFNCVSFNDVITGLFADIPIILLFSTLYFPYKNFS